MQLSAVIPQFEQTAPGIPHCVTVAGVTHEPLLIAVQQPAPHDI
jgi:hypothetical protein